MTRPSHLRTLDLAYIALFAVLMTVCAWITIPFAVPITLQTFAAFLALTTLGGWRGLYAIAVYLLLGAVGLPVFSGFQGGLGVLLGPSGGYLLGFLASALIYHLLTRKWGTSVRMIRLACGAGLLTCYATGTIWFWGIYAKGSADVLNLFLLCGIPFLLPDLLKLALALWLAPRLQKYMK